MVPCLGQRSIINDYHLSSGVAGKTQKVIKTSWLRIWLKGFLQSRSRGLDHAERRGSLRHMHNDAYDMRCRVRCSYCAFQCVLLLCIDYVYRLCSLSVCSRCSSTLGCQGFVFLCGNFYEPICEARAELWTSTCHATYLQTVVSASVPKCVQSLPVKGKCSATNRLIPAKEHGAVQLNVAQARSWVDIRTLGP